MFPSVTGAVAMGIACGPDGLGLGFDIPRTISQMPTKSTTPSSKEMIQCFFILDRSEEPPEECPCSAVERVLELL
jgi:hypothetical protein